MTKSFDVTELVRTFRSGLLALLPVMDAARIRWAEPGICDAWEEIERILYPGADHAFARQDGIRFHAEAAALADARTVVFFGRTLKELQP